MKHRDDHGGVIPFIDVLERTLEGGMSVVDPTAAAAGGGPIQVTRDGRRARVTVDGAERGAPDPRWIRVPKRAG